MNIVTFYATYLIVTLCITVWVARTLHSNGRVFLLEAFHGNETLAASVNHLLVVGFYLVNIGYIALALRTYEPLQTIRQAIEVESSKIGVVVLILGVMHTINIIIFARLRGRGNMATAHGGAMAPPPQVAQS